MAIDEWSNGEADAGLQPWQLRLAVADDALEPLLSEGRTVIVDCSDRTLESGGIYAVRDGDALALWLFLVGFSGQGCRLDGRSIGTLTVLGGSFRLRGPLATDAIKVVGRVVEPLTGSRPALADLAAQQALLGALRETTRAALLQLPAARQCLPAAVGIEQATSALQRALADRSFADRFALEQRLDAIDARLALTEELVAQTPADGLGDVLIKLDTLAALDVEDADALESRLLHSALDALRQMAGATRRPGRETPLSEAMTMSGKARTTSGRVAQPLELTASPRRRR
jgi:hypothetical protein